MNIVYGTEGSDTITPDYVSEGVSGYPTDSADIIYSLGGDDYVVSAGGDDTVYGGSGFVSGGDGNDYLVAGSDSGFVDGGAGNDYLDGLVSYEGDPSGVFINMDDEDHVFGGVTILAKSALDGFGDIDTFGPKVLSGHASSFDDVVFGSDQGGYFFLRAGNDVMFAGGGDDLLLPGSGDDFLDGQDGYDWVAYHDDGYDMAGPITSGVVVDLAAGVAIDGWGDIDTVVSIEAVDGSHLADELYGDGQDNFLVGNAGDDRVDGRAGNDWLLGGAGEDLLTGGAGYDTFVFNEGDGQDLATDFSTGTLLARLEGRVPAQIVSRLVDAGREVSDHVEIRHSEVDSFEDLMQNHAMEVGSDVVLSFDDADALVLANTRLADLSSEMFSIFSDELV